MREILTLTEPSEQTLRSIDRHRDALAKVKGVTRNAIDQMLVGNSHDVYIPFRDRFQKECWAGCDTHHYIDDLLTMQAAAANNSDGVNLTDELIAKFNKDAALSSAVLDAVQDGMTREEAHRLLEVTSELDKVLDRIRHAAHKALSVREIAKMRIDQRRAV